MESMDPNILRTVCVETGIDEEELIEEFVKKEKDVLEYILMELNDEIKSLIDEKLFWEFEEFLEKMVKKY